MRWKDLSLAIFSAAFLLLGRPADLGAQERKLAALDRVAVNVEELGWEERSLGLALAEVKAHAVGQLRSQISRMAIEESAPEFIYIVILVRASEEETGDNPSFAGLVSAEIYRRVRVHATGMNVAAVVWRDLRVVRGDAETAVQQVYHALDLSIGKLAAAWHRDNP